MLKHHDSNDRLEVVAVKLDSRFMIDTSASVLDAIDMFADNMEKDSSAKFLLCVMRVARGSSAYEYSI